MFYVMSAFFFVINESTRDLWVSYTKLYFQVMLPQFWHYNDNVCKLQNIAKWSTFHSHICVMSRGV